MQDLNTLQTQATEIVRRHESLALQANALTKLPVFLAAIPGKLSAPVMQAVYAACRALDFIDADALCVASAWQRQSERTGQFDTSAWPTEAQDFGIHGLPRREAPRNDEGRPESSLRAQRGNPGLRDSTDRHVTDAPRNDDVHLANVDGFAPCPHQLGLYAVLPDAAWVGRMARAGVPTVQLRFKSDDLDAIRREVDAAVQAVQDTGALLFINDHWQAAIAAGAYGVHLGQEDLQELGGADLNAIRAAGLRLGLSSHGYAEMLRAEAVKPSYIALGAVYATTLKRMATPPQGPMRLKMYAQLLRGYPTVAIGGIDATRLPELLASGVGSVAVVRALVADDQPEAQAAALQGHIAAHLASQPA